MSTSIPPDKLEQIKEKLFHGHKIEAIKLYREDSDVGLAQAKEAVEKIEQELRLSAPEKFTAPARGKGCMAALAFVILFAAGVGSVLLR